jgi:hypothetical protein
VADGIADRLRGLLASDVYTDRGRLRSDDLLIRERVGHGLDDASAQLRDLISGWRADRVPPSTRDQPFPPAAALEPIRKAERLLAALADVATRIRGLPLLNADKVWDRHRPGGLAELLQFDWALVGESEQLRAGLAGATALDGIDYPGCENGLRQLTQLIAERKRYAQIS